MQTSKQTSQSVGKKLLKMPKKDIDDINKPRTEIVELAELLQIDCDKFTIAQLRNEVKQKIKEERKYSKPKTVCLND